MFTLGFPSRELPATLSQWIREAIVLTYRVKGVSPPEVIVMHSLRGAVTSSAFRAFPSLETICRAATWSSPNAFIHHYKVDSFAVWDAVFGRRILQSVVQDASVCGYGLSMSQKYHADRDWNHWRMGRFVLPVNPLLSGSSQGQHSAHLTISYPMFRGVGCLLNSLVTVG